VAAGLPGGLAQAFGVAAGELGMCSAAWLFCREVASVAGDAGVSALRDQLGRTFPVLDAVAAHWLCGARGPNLDPTAALATCARAERVVVVGIESAFLDALVPALGVPAALLRRSAFEVDWERVISNYQGQLELVDLDSFQGWAGPKSVLLTFAYGVHGERTHVLPSWMRATGEDVRTQFRSLVAWDVLRTSMYVYPRWLVEAPTDHFTHLV
jgi:hypothetical protein